MILLIFNKYGVNILKFSKNTLFEVLTASSEEGYLGPKIREVNFTINQTVKICYMKENEFLHY